MSDAPDPARWCDSEDMPAELRAVLSAYRERGPSLAQEARMAEALLRRTGALRGARHRGWLAAGAGFVGLALLALLWRPEGVARDLRSTRPEPVAPSAPEAAEGVLQAPVEPAAAPVLPVPPPPATASPSKRVADARVRAPAAPASSVPDPAGELRLLTPARRLVAADPARALALAEDHARSYPRGTFNEERDVIRIEALAHLGQRARASAEGRAFLERYPRSTHRQRVRQVVRAD